MPLTRRLSVCALLLAATGCSNTHQPNSVSTATSAGGNRADDTVATAAPPAVATAFGPIVAVRVAHDIEPSGKALGVGIDFEPWAAKIVAVVDVGGWNDSTKKPLQFMWSSVGSGGTESPLFSQQVEVKPGQRAYATALSPGRLALGTYRVKVVLADAKETIDLYVALPAAEEPLTAIAVGKATSTTDPAATQPSGFSRRRDGADSSVAVGEAPTAGEVGTTGEGQATSEAPAQPGCALSVSPSTEGETMVWANASGCTGDTLVLAVSNGGKEYDVPLAVASGEAMTPYDVNPCALGLDGTTAVTVTYTLKVTGGPDKGKSSAPYSGTRAPTTHDSPPGAGVDSSPIVGSFVATGDQIELHITAADDIKLSHLTVTADPPGPDLVDTPYPGKPRLCHETTDYQYATASYTVPANPPELITFTITATDSAGQHQTVVAQYPTRGIWYGDLVGTITSAGPTFNCAGTFTGPIRVVVASSDTTKGPVDVTGDALVHARGFGCAFPPNFPKTGDVTFSVTGTYDGKAFKLQLAPTGVENQAAFSVGLHLFSVPTPLTIGAVRSGSRTLVAGSTFHRDNSGSEELAGGGGSSTLDGTLSLACCSPNAEPIVPAKAPPRFLGEDD